TALGLAGVRVSWKLHADGGTRSPSPGDVELGQAVSDAQGAFVIAASDTPAAREAYCLAQARGAGATYVIAADTTGTLGDPVELGSQPREIVLAVRPQGSPDRESLQALSTYLTT